MSLNKQQYKNLEMSCIQAIEEGFKFYSQVKLFNVSELEVPAIEYLNELFDWGRMNIKDFDHMKVDIGDEIITIEALDNKINNHAFLDVAESNGHMENIIYVN